MAAIKGNKWNLLFTPKNAGQQQKHGCVVVDVADAGMQQASINLAQSLHEVYEPDWHGKDDVMAIGKVRIMKSDTSQHLSTPHVTCLHKSCISLSVRSSLAPPTGG